MALDLECGVAPARTDRSPMHTLAHVVMDIMAIRNSRMQLPRPGFHFVPIWSGMTLSRTMER